MSNKIVDSLQGRNTSPVGWNSGEGSLARDDVAGRVIAGPGDSMDWMFQPQYRSPNPQAAEIVQSIGAILAGRRVGYDLGRETDLPPPARGPYGGAWNGPVFVLTHHQPEDPGDPSIEFLTCSVREAVATAAKAAREKKVVIFGANLAQQCIGEGLVDEIFIHLLPVLLGDGIRLFGHSGATPVDLETVTVTQAGQVTNLGFSVLRSETLAGRPVS